MNAKDKIRLRVKKHRFLKNEMQEYEKQLLQYPNNNSKCNK